MRIIPDGRKGTTSLAMLAFLCSILGHTRAVCKPLDALRQAEARWLDGKFHGASEAYCLALTAIRQLPPQSLPEWMPEVELAIRRLAALTGSSDETGRPLDVLLKWSEGGEGIDPLVAALARFHAGFASLERRGDVERARAIWKPLGLLESWRIVGPFDNERGRGFETAYPPQTGLELAGRYDGKTREVFWRFLPRPPLAGLVDLNALLRPNDEALAYALTFVRADKPVDVALRFGTDEGFQVWVNGVLVGSADVHRPQSFDQTALGVRLRQGWNVILLKVTEAKESWEFRARLTGTDGSPLADLDDVEISEGEPPAEAVEDLRRMVRAAVGGGGEKAPTASPSVPCHLGVETLLRRRIAKAPEDARDHYLLGTLLRLRQAHDVNQHPDSESLRRAIALDTGPPVYHYELAASHCRQTAFAAQRDDNAWRRAMESAADRGAALASLALARYYFKTFGNVSVARHHLAAALERNPGFGRAIVLGGEIEAAIQFPLAKRRAARRAMEVDGSSSEALLSQAEFSIADGRWGEAVTVLRKVLEGNRFHDPTRWALVDLLLGRGRLPEVETLLEEHVRLHPYATSAHEKLARIALGQGNPAAAAEHLARALSTCPEDHRLLDKQGRAFWELGRRDEALRVWEEALEFQPNFPELRERLEFLRAARSPFEDEFRRDTDAIIAAVRKDGYKPEEGEAVRALLDLKVVEVNADGTTREFVQQIVQVFNDRGVRMFDTFETHYAPNEQVLEFKKVRVVHADGSEEQAKLERFGAEDRQQDASRRRATVDLPALTAGDIFEVEYVREDIVQSFFGDYYGRREIFQSEHAILEKVFILRAPAGRRLYFRQRNLSVEPTRVEDGEEGRTTYSWVVRDVPRVEPEPAMPDPTEIFPVLEISTFQGWDEFSRWYWNLIKKQFESSPEIARKVEELTSGKQTDLERIRALYNFVVTDIRYNVWVFGVHGFKPYNASTVFARRFGDCKDKATLLTVMLRHVGILSHPVLIRAESLRGEEDLTLPMVHHFNHCITYVPAAAGHPELYLDGTARSHSLEELPSMDRGARVLVVKPDGGEVRQVPWNTVDQLAIDEEWTAELGKDFGARIRIRIRPRGDYAVYLRNRYEIPGQRRTLLEEHFGALFAGAKVKNESFSDLADLNKPVSMALTLEVPRFADGSSGEAILPLPDDLFGANRSLAAFAALEERNFDILVGNPRHSRLRVTFLLPEGIAAKSVPRERRIETRFGRFLLTFEKPEARKLVLERVLEFTASRVPVADYESFREFASSVDDLKNEKIILEAEQ